MAASRRRPGQRSGWELATARTQLERAAACWLVGDHVSTEQLISQAYPVIERHARAHDLARCWLYLGLTRMASGALEAADECWEHAEQQWRDLGKPLHLHRILLQRSWIPIFWSRFGDAVETDRPGPRTARLVAAQQLAAVRPARQSPRHRMACGCVGGPRFRQFRRSRRDVGGNRGAAGRGARHPARRGRHPGILARR